MIERTTRCCIAGALVTLGATLFAQSREPAPLSLRPLWSQPLGGALSAPPAFAGTRAYVAIDGRRLEAFDLIGGGRRWSIEAGALTRPAVGDDLVFVEVPGALLALRESDGTTAWRLPLTDPLGAPVVWDNGWLIAQSATGVVSAHRAVDGHVIWQHETGSAPSAPAALAADRVYVSLADGRVVALQVEHGTPLWERRLGGAAGEILAIDDRLYLGTLGSEDRAFYALDPRSGRVEWRWRTGGAIVGRAAIDDRSVYFVCLDNVLRALDRNNGAQRWYAALPLRPSGAPVIAGDTLIVPGAVPTLPSFFRTTGAPADAATLPGDLAATPHVVDHPWAPIVVTITRDIAEGDSLRALGRPVGPGVVPLTPLPGVEKVPAPSPPRGSSPAPPSDAPRDTPGSRSRPGRGASGQG